MKYPSEDQFEEMIGSQAMARQCLISAIRHQSEGESSAYTERDLLQPKKAIMSLDAVAEGESAKS